VEGSSCRVSSVLIRDTLEVAYKGVGVASRTPATGLLSPETAAPIAAVLTRPALTGLLL